VLKNVPLNSQLNVCKRTSHWTDNWTSANENPSRRIIERIQTNVPLNILLKVRKQTSHWTAYWTSTNERSI